METQFDKKIKRLQTDWGGEFQRLSSFLRFHGITHWVSCPYTPRQKGHVERKHCHVVEMGLSLLTHSNLPLNFWSFAFQIAIYLINRLPTPILSNITLYQKLYGHSPDYTILQTFRCACFPFLQPYNSHKLLFRST